MPKVIHLIKRKAPQDVAGFQTELRERTLRSVPPQGCRRYVQSHSLLQGYKKGELLFDAVEEAWFDDMQDALAYQDQPLWTALDRADIIEGERCLSMLVEAHVVKDGAVPSGAMKNIEFVNRRPGMAVEAFQHYWKHVHGPIGAGIPSMLRYEQNHTLPEQYAAGEPRYDGLAITWFASTNAMRAGAETEAYRITRADEQNFLPDGHLPIIITTEVIDTGRM